MHSPHWVPHDGRFVSPKLENRLGLGEGLLQIFVAPVYRSDSQDLSADIITFPRFSALEVFVTFHPFGRFFSFLDLVIKMFIHFDGHGGLSKVIRKTHPCLAVSLLMRLRKMVMRQHPRPTERKAGTWNAGNEKAGGWWIQLVLGGDDGFAVG